ncbi:MAG: alanine--glyoxylate aminotransferase family protein [Chloroflexi bacterium]|nr:alanine--glyoxylate aminotransferase family protein [Chloroflexota bacterium]
MNLRIVGPTPLPPAVCEALARPMINHRGPEFAAMQARIVNSLKTYFQTAHEILLFTCSGTGGLEAAVVNLLSPGDTVVAVSIGVFGDRFAEIAELFGAQVHRLRFAWGSAADPDALRAKLDELANVRAVLITHNETSTATTNPLQELARAVHERSDALLVVDAISSLGAIHLPVDEWGVDVAVTGSQKVWMIPPGLAMLSVGPRAWEAYARAKMPRFYWDFKKMRDAMAKGQTAFTPGVNLYFGLDVALELMNAEGFENIRARHARVAQHTRDCAQAQGFELFANQAFASNTVTALKIPPGVDGKKWREVLRKEHDTVIAGGQKELTDKIVRIGHLGWVNEADIDACLHAMTAALVYVRAS